MSHCRCHIMLHCCIVNLMKCFFRQRFDRDDIVLHCFCYLVVEAKALSEERQLLGLGELGDDFSEEVLDLLTELEMENVWGSSVRSEKNSDARAPSRKEKIFSDVIKQPLPDDIRREGRNVFCGPTKCGHIAYLTHWTPAAIVATCNLHTDCFVSCPLVSGDEDSLVQWLGEAVCFSSGSDHSACRPRGSYNKRMKTEANT